MDPGTGTNPIVTIAVVGADPGPTSVAVEREAKLIAPVEFRVPDLNDLLSGATATAMPERRLGAVYYDTADRRLLRCGITLRHRSGEGGLPWTVKLPGAADRHTLVRREIGFAGTPDDVPDAAIELVLAATRGHPLTQLLHLATVRRPVEIRDRDDKLLAEIVDDTVSAFDGPVAASHFREIEVEVWAPGHAGQLLLDTAITRLRDAGCVAEPPTPKLVRALGIHGVEPPEVAVAPLGSHVTVTDLVEHAITRSVTQILRHDPGARLGDDPEDVHQLRVGARRLRSDLRSFELVLDRARVGDIRDELGWLGSKVGAVRDRDVLAVRLHTHIQTLPTIDAPGATSLLRRLDTETDIARMAMRDALRSACYLHLLDALIDLAQNPPLLADPERANDTPGDIARAIARRPWRRLANSIHNLGPDSPDADLHQARIRAKRARYAIEAIAPLVGRPATDLADAIADLQTCLGDHQDTVVAETWLRDAAAADPNAGVAAGQLIALERSQRVELRNQWPAIWHAASTKHQRRWLHDHR